MRAKLFVFILINFYFLNHASAEEKKIQDNSFLIEEAYNQEPRVVQHIMNYQYNDKTRLFTYSFTQEWPAPNQTHQLSYTLQMPHVESPQSTTSIGDVTLNYRYQMPMKHEVLAVAPRFSIILPTGDYKKSLGTGAVGYQVNLPVSIEWNDKIVNHWNLGLTATPGSKTTAGETANTISMNYGMSLIYLMSSKINLMLEFSGTSTESPSTGGTKTRQESFVINPGLRYAIDFKSGMQVVPGLSFPIGVGPSDNEKSIFLYTSVEHGF